MDAKGRRGALIASRRKERNLSQESLGEMVGLRQNQISQIENGKRGISDKARVQIAVALDLMEILTPLEAAEISNPPHPREKEEVTSA
ncbi:helix-turn-helix domain-containing protein [Dethiosulfovibrio sp. F2B]|uniref:helix-turn-helix domain-containing protein n=1 Tax=Dethiosulfovibrio faecalis TaxID=2720018 RepID=UPI001F355C4B|nr:helix-turn-helix domain-containing protein [Dethiosulfovibrio faecalis]